MKIVLIILAYLLGALIGAGIICALAWVAGFNFDERSQRSFLVSVFALMGAVYGLYVVSKMELS